MSYSHFTLDERFVLHDLLTSGYSLRKIADKLGRNVSSVSREIRKNSSENEYHPFSADIRATERRKNCTYRSLSPGTPVWDYIISKLKLYWSPEAICGRWNKEHPNERQIHFSTIYRYIKRGELPDIVASQHLRRRGVYTTMKGKYSHKYDTIKPNRLITDWPEEILNRSRIGDWEGDTVMGGMGKGLAITLVDRSSRYLCCVTSPTKKAATCRELISSLLKDKTTKSISFDNGVEFAEHEKLETELNTLVYFAEPHKPWQRGTNENTNGILRFFFPKGCDFREVSVEEMNRVVKLINQRPRKVLDWLTPEEVFLGSSVALD